MALSRAGDRPLIALRDRGSTDSGPARELAREVLIHGPISRGELGRRLGLSPASLTRLSRPFLESGLFVDAPENPERSLGRPAKPLDVRLDSRRFIGVKITGTQVFGVATDLRATPQSEKMLGFSGREPADVIDAIARLVAELGGTEGLTAVGVSIGGQVGGSRIVKRAPFLGWRDVPLAQLLEEALHIPVVVENDVVALTAAEHWFGEARGLENFAVITTGAGVGYALVIHDHPVVGSDVGLGLGGHFPLDPSGPLCPEGHRGCSTAMLSIPSMCASARVGLGREVDYTELLRLARGANPVAVEVVGAAARALGRFIAAVANLTMVDSIVLSGEGIGLVDDHRSLVMASARADRDPEAAEITLLLDHSGFGAWARGAAAVAIQASFV